MFKKKRSKAKGKVLVIKLNTVDLNTLKSLDPEVVKNRIQQIIAREIRKKEKKVTPGTKVVKQIYETNSATRRAELIKKQTNSEKIMKAKLKALGIDYEFQKIIPIDYYYYIVDFYIPKYHLILEIDGGYHETVEQEYKDKDRTLNLKLNKYPNLKRLSNKRAEDIDLPSLDKFIKI